MRKERTFKDTPELRAIPCKGNLGGWWYKLQYKQKPVGAYDDYGNKENRLYVCTDDMPEGIISFCKNLHQAMRLAYLRIQQAEINPKPLQTQGEKQRIDALIKDSLITASS